MRNLVGMFMFVLSIISMLVRVIRVKVRLCCFSNCRWKNGSGWFYLLIRNSFSRRLLLFSSR